MKNSFEIKLLFSVLILAVLAVLVLFSTMDVTIMEARNFISAREMINDGNWLLTTMNGEARYQKPPFPTWLSSVMYAIFGGKHILAMRFPAILMLMFLIYVNRKFASKIYNDNMAALRSCLILISSFYVIAITIEAPWDIYAHTFMYMGLYSTFRLFNSKKAYWKHTLLAGLFIGLSILSKGPVSLYALFLPFIIAYLMVFKVKAPVSKTFSLFFLLILALSVGGWWYLYVRLADPNSFMEIASKETSNWSSYNVRPFYYYWSFFTQSGIWTIPAFMGLLYPYMKTKVENVKAYKFTLIWTFATVILLSIIPEKKSRYLMPVLIPLALNTGFYIEYLIKEFKNLKKWKHLVPVYCHFLIIGIICFLIPFAIYFFLKENDSQVVFILLSAMLFIPMGILLIRFLKQRKMKQLFYLNLIFVFVVAILLAPLSEETKAVNYQDLYSLNEDFISQEDKLYSYGSVSPELIWQYGGKIEKLTENDDGVEWPIQDEFYLLMEESKIEEVKMLTSEFKIDKLQTYDLNRVSVEERAHKSRLKRVLFRLTKK